MLGKWIQGSVLPVPIEILQYLSHSTPPQSTVNYLSHHFAAWDCHRSRKMIGKKDICTSDWKQNTKCLCFSSKATCRRTLCTCFRCAFKPSCVAFSSALTVKLSGSSLSRIWDSFNSDSSFFLMKDSTWCSVVPLFWKELSNANDFPYEMQNQLEHTLQSSQHWFYNFIISQ